MGRAAENDALYLSDAEIGKRVLGATRAKEWGQIAPLLERRGLPKIDRLMGGRYWPAVKRFFDVDNGLESALPLAPSGIEDATAWRKSKRRA